MYKWKDIMVFYGKGDLGNFFGRGVRGNLE